MTTNNDNDNDISHRRDQKRKQLTNNTNITSNKNAAALLLLAAAILTGCQANAFSTLTSHTSLQQPLRPPTNSLITPSNAAYLNFRLLSSPQNQHEHQHEHQHEQHDTTTTATTTKTYSKSKHKSNKNNQQLDTTSKTDQSGVTTSTSFTASNNSNNSSNKKVSVLSIAAVTLSAVAIAAKVGILPGSDPYSNTMLAQDTGMALLTGTLGYLFVKFNTWAAEKNYLSPRDSRKLIHTFSAPLFMIFWPFFSANEGARFFAASVSFINMVRLFLAGSGSDASLAYAVSRYVPVYFMHVLNYVNIQKVNFIKDAIQLCTDQYTHSFNSNTL